MNEKELEKMLTIKDVTKLLNISRATLYKIMDDGRLTSYLVGGQRRFKRADIEAYLEGQKNK